MVFWLWFLFGALFGGLVAQRKGWSVPAGVIGGALLGPLSLLLLFVSGSGGEKTARSAGAQVGRALLFVFGALAILYAVTFVYVRLRGRA